MAGAAVGLGSGTVDGLHPVPALHALMAVPVANAAATGVLK